MPPGRKGKYVKKKDYKRKWKRQFYGKNDTMLTYRPKSISRMNTAPLPNMYFTKFIAAGAFYSGSGMGTGSNQFNYKLNSLYLPFANAGGSVTFLGGLNIATFQCPGYSNLLNANMYTKYLVLGTKFEFSAMPQSVADNVIVTASVSTTGGTPANVGTAVQKPWTRSLHISVGKETGNKGDYPIKMYIPIHKYMGLPKILYQNDQSGQWMGTYNADATNTLEIVTNVSTGDGDVYSLPIEYRVRITYYVRLSSLNSEAMA